MKPLTQDEAYRKVAASCARSEKCVKDVRDKLTAWNVNVSLQNDIIDRLIDEKFIDEERFCRFYVKDKLRFNQWGKIKIGLMLKQKGIKQTSIDKALGTIDNECYENILEDLLRKKLKNLSYKNDYEKIGKLTRFAISRGFESELINSITKHLDK